MKKLLFLAPLLLGACVSSGDFQRLERQVNDLQDDIADLKRQASSKEEVERLNSSVGAQIDRLLKSNAEVTAKLSDIDEKLDNNQGGVEQANHRVDRLAQQIAAIERAVGELRSAAPATGGAAPLGEEVTVEAPPNSGDDPVAIYQSAYKDLQGGKFDLAYEGFEEFLRTNPRSDLADNAAYWMGEALYAQKKFQESIERYNVVITTYPTSDKVPAALLKKGYAYLETGERAQGIIQLQYVVHEHPKSQEASLARQKLKQLGIVTK
jgi:tol-pal system protein YbgF